MAWSLDGRIPITVVSDEAGLAAALAAGAPAAVLAETPPERTPFAVAVAVASFDAVLPSHAAACACCGGRAPAAAALDRLFQARVRGQCDWFERVVAVARTAAARQVVMAALRDDPLTAARFRLG